MSTAFLYNVKEKLLHEEKMIESFPNFQNPTYIKIPGYFSGKATNHQPKSAGGGRRWLRLSFNQVTKLFVQFILKKKKRAGSNSSGTGCSSFHSWWKEQPRRKALKAPKRQSTVLTEGKQPCSPTTQSSAAQQPPAWMSVKQALTWESLMCRLHAHQDGIFITSGHCWQPSMTSW